jgi:hypothetical protein
VIEYYPRLGPVYQISGNIGPGPWAFHRFPVGCFTTVRSGATEAIYGAHPTANRYMWLFAPVGTDDGGLFITTIQSGYYDLGDPILTKYLRRIKVVGRGKFTLQVLKNFQNAVASTKTVNLTFAVDAWGDETWGSSSGPGTWGPDAPSKEQIINFDLYGRVFGLRITDSETTTGILLLPVGSVDYQLTLGEWSFYEATINGQLLGLRGVR